jgi:hypothetical protein
MRVLAVPASGSKVGQQVDEQAERVLDLAIAREGVVRERPGGPAAGTKRMAAMPPASVVTALRAALMSGSYAA